MLNQSYNEGFKRMAVRKLSMPSSQGLNATAREIGIAASTLFGWKEKYANNSIMKNKKNEFTPEKKLQILLETHSLLEQELGEYLRKNGIYYSELEEWKKDFYNSQKRVGRPKKDPEIQVLKNKEKELIKNIRRKDKALAEMSARVVLLKKSHLIFGVEEDEG